jgi:hypothetical protein
MIEYVSQDEVYIQNASLPLQSCPIVCFQY